MRATTLDIERATSAAAAYHIYRKLRRGVRTCARTRGCFDGE